VIYAQTSYGVTMTSQQAHAFRKRYFEGYSGISGWHRVALREGKQRKMTRTLSGRLRWLEDEKAHNEFLNCLDFETEALTQRGWVKGPDLVSSDVLLTKNPTTNELEWQQPTDLRVFAPAMRDVVEFKSRSFHAVSTPDHRWLVRNKASGKDIERVTSKISLHGDDRIHRTGQYRKTSGEFSDDFVELAGWWLTDGGIHKTRRVTDRPGKRGPQPSGVSLKLFQSTRANPAKVARIEALLGRLGIQPKRYLDPVTQGAMWYFRDPLNETLLRLCPGRVLSMDFLLRLSSKQLFLLQQTMIDGDGNRGSKTSFVNQTRAGAEAFQILCTMCGVAASITKRDMSKYTPVSKKLRNIPKGKTHWVVTLLRRDKVQVLSRHVQAKREVIGVWCPIVPNTFFVARRSGHVFVTGNTPVQGTGADGLKRALRKVYDRLKKYDGKVFLTHMVHDEIVLDSMDDPEILAAAQLDLKEGMEEGIAPLLRKVPAESEGGTGDSWADK
jgi:hypothetical protein